MIAFTVPGQPQGKGRPRVGKVKGQARMFTPEKTVAYENLVALAAQQAMTETGRTALLEGPVAVTMYLCCQIPASWSGKKQRAADAHEIHPTSKPDADNVVKAVFDAMNGVVWKDDTQVVDLSVRKRYGQVPGVRVQVSPIPPNH